MNADSRAAVVSGPVVLLALVNAILFGVGALLHAGVEVFGLAEPIVMPAMMLESLAALVLALGTLGVFTRASWARKVAGFANVFAIAVVVAVAMLLGLDDGISSAGLKLIQLLRLGLAVACLILLHLHTQRVERRG